MRNSGCTCSGILDMSVVIGLPRIADPSGCIVIEAGSIENLSTSIVFQALGGESDSGDPGLLLGAGLEGLRKFIDAPVVQPSSDGPPVLVSMRNQLTLTITPSILAFRDASGQAPAREDFPSRVAQVAGHIGVQSHLSYSMLGFVFEIESKIAEGEIPSQVMLRRFVKEEALENTGYGAIGASVRLWYRARERIHGLRVEPKGDQYDSCDYFAHVDVQMELRDELPSAEWLSLALNEEYRDFLRVLDQVLKPEGR